MSTAGSVTSVCLAVAGGFSSALLFFGANRKTKQKRADAANALMVLVIEAQWVEDA